MALLEAGRAMGRAFSVRELHSAAQTAEPKLGLTTAYRTVERWRQEGWAEDAGMRGGESVYVLCAAQGHHHHVVCVECGATALLEGCALEPVRAAARSAGFDLLDPALGSLPARCAGCAGADAGSG
jgi:Fur family ferric uptake transcriptional regulator